MKLDHIALIISCEENLRFYKKLGFKEINRLVRSHDIVVFLECDGIILETFIDPKHPERVNAPEARGLRHIAFTLDNLDDLNIEHEEIKIDWFGRRFTFVKDLDGQPIELKERG